MPILVESIQVLPLGGGGYTDKGFLGNYRGGLDGSLSIGRPFWSRECSDYLMALEDAGRRVTFPAKLSMWMKFEFEQTRKCSGDFGTGRIWLNVIPPRSEALEAITPSFRSWEVMVIRQSAVLASQMRMVPSLLALSTRARSSEKMAELTKEPCPRNSLIFLPDFRPCKLGGQRWRGKESTGQAHQSWH